VDSLTTRASSPIVVHVRESGRDADRLQSPRAPKEEVVMPVEPLLALGTLLAVLIVAALRRRSSRGPIHLGLERDPRNE